MNCAHERFGPIPEGEGCFLCWVGCEDDWEAATCTHRYSNHFESLLDSDGQVLTYFAECDACGARLQ